MTLNRQLMQHYKPPEAIFVEWSKETTALRNSPQSLWLWPGQDLISAAAKFQRNVTYTVKEVSVESVLLVRPGAEVKLNPQQVCEFFRPSFCRTYHSAQGLGFQRVRLWGYRSPHFSLKHLVTGLSRCYAYASVDFGHARQETQAATDCSDP